MDTVKDQGAFYKQANAHNDAEEHARTTSPNGYFVLEQTTKSCRLWLAISAPFPERTKARYGLALEREYGRFYEKSNFDSRP